MLRSQQHPGRRLQRVEHNLGKIATAVSSAAEQADMDRCLLEQSDEQVSGVKLEVFDVSCSILSLDGDVSELIDYEASILQTVFNICL